MSHFILRNATLKDIPMLAKHNRLMYEEDMSVHGEPIQSELLDMMDVEYQTYLSFKIKNKTAIAWVVEIDNQIVGSCVLSFLEWVPTPFGSQRTLLHSVYIEPLHRKQGLGSALIQEVVHHCRSNNIKRIVLHATDSARKIYESYGFKFTNEMALSLRFS